MTLDGKPKPQQGDLRADLAQADPAQSPAGTSLRSLIYETGVYGVGMVLARGLGIFLTPILARSLSAAEFGVLDLAQAGAALGSMLLGLQLESAILRYFQRTDDDARGRLLSTALALHAAAGLILVIAALAAVPLLTPWVSASIVVLAAVSVLTGFLYTDGLTVLRAEREATRAASVIGANTVLNVIGIVGLVGFGGWGVAGVFASRATADAICAAAILHWRRAYYRLAWVTRTDAAQLIGFGARLTPEGFIGYGSAHIGKAILLSYGSLSEVGLLAVANRIALAIKLALSSLRQAWLPYAFSISARPDANETYARALSGYIRVAGPLCVGFVLLAPEALLLFAGREYMGAQRVMGPLGAAAVIGGLPYIFNIALLLEEKLNRYTVSVLITFLVTVVASLLLIPLFGIVGASLAGLAAALASAGSMLYFAQRVRPIPYDYKLLYEFVAGVTALGLAGAAGWLDVSLWIRLPILALVGMATAGTVFRELRARRRAHSS